MVGVLLVAAQLYPDDERIPAGGGRQWLAQQLYPNDTNDDKNEDTPVMALLADQLYPPEPAPAPAPDVLLAEQLYPPEPAPSPNEQRLRLSNTVEDAMTKPIAINALAHEQEAPAFQNRMEVNAVAGKQVGRSSPMFGMRHVSTARMDMTPLYTAGGLLLVIVGALIHTVVRRKQTSKNAYAEATRRWMECPESHESFLE